MNRLRERLCRAVKLGTKLSRSAATNPSARVPGPAAPDPHGHEPRFAASGLALLHVLYQALPLSAHSHPVFACRRAIKRAARPSPDRPRRGAVVTPEGLPIELNIEVVSPRSGRVNLSKPSCPYTKLRGVQPSCPAGQELTAESFTSCAPQPSALSTWITRSCRATSVPNACQAKTQSQRVDGLQHGGKKRIAVA